ncbi:liprin-beta-2 isoform X5 [Chrysoperla carnea]|uniref:liprin-beta-2 isoform X5 n=1 Tax=Chrysoperla carnea TaxID=189513 RepID=UPI001D069EE1|nr:liprin-beta-2 isoform X5 [Chrysoperla carnea]
MPLRSACGVGNNTTATMVGGGALVASTVAMLEQKSNNNSSNIIRSKTPPRRFQHSTVSRLTYFNKNCEKPSSQNNSFSNLPPDVSTNNNLNDKNCRSPDILPKKSSDNTTTPKIIDSLPKKSIEPEVVLHVDEENDIVQTNSSTTMSKSNTNSSSSSTCTVINNKEIPSPDHDTQKLRPLSSSSSDGGGSSTTCSETAVVNVCGDDDDDSSEDDSSDECSDDSDMTSDDESSSGREFTVMEDRGGGYGSSNNQRGLEPITEEERPVTSSSINTLEEDDSTCCDEDFQWISSSRTEEHSPTPNGSSYNSTPPEEQRLSSTQYQKPAPRSTQHNPHRLRTDNSPRRSVERSAPGSLDRRRPHHNHSNRQDRDSKSKSTHTPLQRGEKEYRHQSPSSAYPEFHFPPPPPRCELYNNNGLPPRHWNYASSPSACDEQTQWNGGSTEYCNDYDCFHKHHERNDPKRYGSSSLLVEYPSPGGPGGGNTHQYHHRLGSQPDLYGTPEVDRGGRGLMSPLHSWRGLPPSQHMCCAAYHTLPPMPCCHHGPPTGCYDSDVRNYSTWNNYHKSGEQDEKIKRLENDKDTLQMQVQVLTEQIETQSDKIAELEKLLSEKKQLLGNAEDLLQRVRTLATYIASHIDKQKEMLSRSSLETQKLELMSAMSELKLQQAALERENIELRTSHYASQLNGNHVITNQSATLTNINKKPPLIPRTSPIPQHTSTPVHHSTNTNQISSTILSSTPSPISGNTTSNTPLSTRNDDNQPRTPPPNYRRTVDLHYGSLPRQTYLSTNGLIMDNNANSSQTNLTGVPNSASVPSRKGVAFGKGISSLLGGARGRGHSVPNLAETEKVVIEDSNDGVNSFSPQASPSLNKNKGDGEFRRGGVRATAGPRLCWSQPPDSKRPDKPFHEWDIENICDWLQELGLEAYLTEAKRWVKDGAQLQAATGHEFEKELGIKNPLHRKKLQLAILDLTDNGTNDTLLASAGRLDTAWVLRWLDDTGLPQHKDAFLQARIDGRLLHRLTVDDLATLHVTSLLHATSIRRGIQVLREHDFDPGCLIRRSLPDESLPETKDIALWTAHRVMEWLRVVDLAEYAPNLRGAGVHGALMVYEPKFTAELMATLLNIPPSKTLLRRHLSTHFKELLGRDVIQEKREAETVLGYIPLTPATKLKIVKKSQFSLKRKKSKGELDFGDLVCPMKTGQSSSQSGEIIANNNGTSTHGDAISSGTMKKTPGEKDMAVYHLVNDGGTDDVFHAHRSSPLPQRLKDSILV